jgi:hypothetical protein
MTRVCTYCGNAFTPHQNGRQQYCGTTCYQQAALGRARAKKRSQRVAFDARSCPQCRASFVPRNKEQKYCSDSCGQRHRLDTKYRKVKAERQAKRGARTCRRCHVSIAERPPTSVQCERCYRLAQLESKQRSAAVRRGARAPKQAVRVVKAKAKSVTLANSTIIEANRASKKKPDPTLPNFDGDWFKPEGDSPGFDGCWSRNIPPEGRELIRKHFGPDPDPEELKKLHAPKSKRSAA